MIKFRKLNSAGGCLLSKDRCITRMVKLSLFFHINAAFNEINLCAVCHMYAIPGFACTNLSRHQDVSFFNASLSKLTFYLLISNKYCHQVVISSAKICSLIFSLFISSVRLNWA